MEKTAFNANYVPKTAPQILYISKNHLQTDYVSPYEKYSVLDYRIAINLKNKRIDTLISILKTRHRLSIKQMAGIYFLRTDTDLNQYLIFRL